MRSIQWLKSSIRRWKARRKRDRAAVAHDDAVLKQRQAELEQAQAAQAKAVWKPGVVRSVEPDSGAYRISCPSRLVWHTTEGVGLPNYSGTSPHFTIDPLTGKTWQHIPINRAAMALEHVGAPETNHAHAIQIEVIGFADAAAARRLGHPERAVINFTDAQYARLADLARWIEHNAGVARKCSVTFAPSGRFRRMTNAEWLAYHGHCGHQHVPNQPSGHWDPGLFDIKAVLG